MHWVAALLACGCVSLAEVSDWPAAQDYIAEKSCSLSAEPAHCRTTRDTWIDTYHKATLGNYQSQHTVAICLSTGCDGAITESRMFGCAWQQTIAGSRHPEYTAADKDEVAKFCGQEWLDNADRQTARDQADVFLTLLGISK